MKNKILSLSAHDAVKGFIVAFITAFLASIYQWLSSGSFPTLQQLGTAGIAGLTAGIGYLIKNYFTNSQDKFMTPEPKQLPK